MLRLPESDIEFVLKKASLDMKPDRQVESLSQMNQPILINSKDIFENADMVDKPNHLIGDASRFDVLTLDVETPKLLPPKHRHTITIHQRYLRSNQIPYWPEMTWACPNFYLKNLGFATPTWKEDSPQRPWSCEWESCASDRKSDEAVNMKRSCMFMQCFFIFPIFHWMFDEFSLGTEHTSFFCQAHSMGELQCFFGLSVAHGKCFELSAVCEAWHFWVYLRIRPCHILTERLLCN